MSASPYVAERQIALEAVQQAARLCQAVQQDLRNVTHEKNDRSPVTVADFGSQALVCKRIREAFPEDPIIAEEDSAALREDASASLLDQVVANVQSSYPEATADDVCSWIDYGGAGSYSTRFWTLDPIDGTKGFLRGDQYAVALALIVNGEIVVAALACPNLPTSDKADAPVGSVYMAVRGQGTQNIPIAPSASEQQVQVSNQEDPSQARFCESVESGHTAHGQAAEVARTLNLTAPPVRIDSQCKYAMVARGDAEVYLRLPTRPGYVEKIWDHAAGVLVVTEAGGMVTDITGAPLDFTKGWGLHENRGVIVTNGALHDQVQQAVTSTEPNA